MNQIRVSEEYVISEYNKGRTLNSISSDAGVSRQRLSAILKKRRIKTRKRKYTVDESYFNIIDTTNKAYWLGFIYGDGCIDKSLEFVRIKLSSRDHNHLEKFKADVKSSVTIKRFKSKTNFSESEFSSITICSKKICYDLINNNCIPSKSKLRIFPIVSKKYYKDFLRGLIDSDGYISYDTNRSGIKRPTVGITGNELTIIEGKKMLEDLGITNIKVRKDKRKIDFYELRIRKYSEVLKTYNLLYKDSNVFLDRKKNKLFNLINEASTIIIAPPKAKAKVKV